MQTFKLKAVLAAMIVSLGVTACGGSSSSSSTPENQTPDNPKPVDPVNPDPGNPEPVAKKPVWTLYKYDARTSAGGSIDGVYDSLYLRSRSYVISDGLIQGGQVTTAADGQPDTIKRGPMPMTPPLCQIRRQNSIKMATTTTMSTVGQKWIIPAKLKILWYGYPSEPNNQRSL